jgi:hypothetical protein
VTDLAICGRALLRPTGLALVLTLALGACSSGEDPHVDNTGGTTSSGGQTSSGGANVATGGASSGGHSGGTTQNSGGSASGGRASGSGGETTATGGDGSGGAPSSACTRELLDGLLDAYFDALSAGDPSSLPLATDVKFTENGEALEIGMTDFWQEAGDTKHSQRLLDTEQCGAAAQAVVPEGSTDLPVAVRLKVESGELTEIETIVVRPGDYTASFAVASDPAAIIAIAEDIGWHDEVPEAERATREELMGWIDKYFRAFPQGVCNVSQACRRLENGGGNFSCGTGATCTQGAGSGGFEPRVILADEVRGIAAGFTIFDYMTDGHLDMHMMKMSGGQVHAVHALLRDTDGQSGWD